MFVECLGWCLPFQRLAGSAIQGCGDGLEVVGGPIPFARDGEVTGSGTVLDLDVAYRALTVYRPRTGSWSRVLRRFGWRRQGVTAS